MRLLRVFSGFLFVLAVTPAFAQADLGQPDPVESSSEEAEPAITPARKPTPPPRPAKPAAPVPAAAASPKPAAQAATANPATPAAVSAKPATQSAATPATDPPADTILTEPARAAEFGWRVVEDTATGARLGLPTAMLPKKQDTRDGTLWSSRQGDMQVETFRLNNGLALAALFEMEKQRLRRKVEYSALKGDNFVIAGLQGLRKFTVRAQAKDGEVRGLTLQYDQAIEGIVEPIANAMASTFTPYPANGVTPAPVSTRKVEYGSGVVISAAGHIVTDRRLTDNCQTLVVAGHGPAETIAADENFTLLQIFGARGLNPAALAADATAGDVTLRGVPEPQSQDGKNDVKDIAAKVTTDGVLPSLGGGFSGAGVFRDGRLAGIVSLRNGIYASTVPAAPQAALLPVAALRTFLTLQKIPASETTDGAATVLRLICVRK
jgi:hypothetical protein